MLRFKQHELFATLIRYKLPVCKTEDYHN